MRSRLLATTIVATIGTVVWTGAWAQSANNPQRTDKEMSQEGGNATKAPAQQKEKMKRPETGQAGQAQTTPAPTTGQSEKSTAGKNAQTESGQATKPQSTENMKSSAGTGGQAERKTGENTQPAMQNREKKPAGQASGKQESGSAMKSENGGRTSATTGAQTSGGEKAQSESNRQPSSNETGANRAGTSETRQGEAAKTNSEKQSATGTSTSAGGKGEQNATVTGSVHISRENASRVATALMSSAPAQRNMNINVEVGAPLPGNLELRALPPDVVSLVPEYRGYEYVVAGDEIVIVQPSTRKVVEVIREGRTAQAPERPSHRARISLSEAQRRQLVDSVRKEKLPEAQIAELSDGETIPQDIQLEPLPPMIATDIPTIDQYRVVVVPGDRVVLVDPETREVIDVID